MRFYLYRGSKEMTTMFLSLDEPLDYGWRNIPASCSLMAAMICDYQHPKVAALIGQENLDAVLAGKVLQIEIPAELSLHELKKKVWEDE